MLFSVGFTFNRHQQADALLGCEDNTSSSSAVILRTCEINQQQVEGVVNMPACLWSDRDRDVGWPPLVDSPSTRGILSPSLIVLSHYDTLAAPLISVPSQAPIEVHCRIAAVVEQSSYLHGQVPLLCRVIFSINLLWSATHSSGTPLHFLLVD